MQKRRHSSNTHFPSFLFDNRAKEWQRRQWRAYILICRTINQPTRNVQFTTAAELNKKPIAHTVQQECALAVETNPRVQNSAATAVETNLWIQAVYNRAMHSR
mmetsp:Transcript_3331/g.7222  ORF Transcript_3331/g.7222 Transcript_3331/m.7222 type:complete len:103 (+) Transcript_3331:203-511(+)